RLGIQASHRDSVARWLGSFPGTTFYTYASPRLRGGVMMARFTHGPQLAYAVSGDRIWIGDSGHDTISVYDRTASLVASVVWPEAARPLSAEALQRVRDRELAEADDDDRRNGIEALHGTALRTATAPF